MKLWQIEYIPDEDNLFCRVHFSKINRKVDGTPPKPNAFFNTPFNGDNLSSDWDRYTTAIESRELISKQFRYNTQEFKNQYDFFIYKLDVEIVRQISPQQNVEHDPIENFPEKVGLPNNRSHSIIIGDKGDKNDTEIRLKFSTSGTWAIKPELE